MLELMLLQSTHVFQVDVARLGVGRNLLPTFLLRLDILSACPDYLTRRPIGISWGASDRALRRKKMLILVSQLQIDCSVPFG